MTLTTVIPVRDREDLVAAALDSVLGQTLPPDQVIVVDDGSIDRTHAIVAGFGDRVTVIATTGIGPAGARNAGLEAATCDRIAFLDSDDIWPPDALASLSAAMTRESADITWGFTRTEILPGGGLPDPKWPVGPSRLVLIPSMLFRTAALRDLGGFDASMRFGEDNDLLMRAKERPLSIAETSEIVLVHRRHPGNMTNDQRSAARAWFDIARKARQRGAQAVG